MDGAVVGFMKVSTGMPGTSFTDEFGGVHTGARNSKSPGPRHAGGREALFAPPYVTWPLVIGKLASGSSKEREIGTVDCGSITEGNDLVGSAAVIVDLPMCGVVLREGRTRAVADELHDVSRRRAVAVEVGNSVAIGFSDVKDEGVVAGVAGHSIGAAATVEDVVAAVAVGLKVSAALQDQVVDVGREPEVNGREY